jgi:membrane protein
MSIKKWRKKLPTWVEQLETQAATSSHRWLRFLSYMARLIGQVVRQWVRDRCPQQAASLAFQTVLSLVPTLAVCLAAFRAFGNIDAESSFVAFVSERLIPVSPDVIAEQLKKWTGNISFQSLSLFGLVSIGFLAFVMFNNLEKAMNRIWRAEKKRPLTQKFMLFYASISLGPLLVGTSIYQAAKVGLITGHAGYFVSFATSFLAVFLVFMYLPTIRVRWKNAAIGALVTTATFEIAKYAFKYYITEFALAGYSGIYGAIATIPIFMIWVYWSWLMLLLGVEVSHAVQNIQTLQRMDRRQPMTLEHEIVLRVNGPMAARILVAVTEAYMSGNKVVSRQALADRFDLSEDVLLRICDRLKESNFLMEVEGEQVGFLPARPPHEISLAAVLKAFRGEDSSTAKQRSQGALDEVLKQMEEDAMQRTEHLTLDQLVTGKS